MGKINRLPVYFLARFARGENRPDTETIVADCDPFCFHRLKWALKGSGQLSAKDRCALQRFFVQCEPGASHPNKRNSMTVKTESQF